ETAGMTTAYSGTYTVPGTGWQEITLTTPFYWNGTNSLLVEICFNNSSYTSNSTVNGTPNSLNQLKHQHSDLSSGDGCTQITTPSSSYTARPNVKLTISPSTAIGNENNGIPTVFSLSQNYPNPFNPVTKINFAIPKQSQVLIKVYDILGREVVTLVNDVKSPGYYSVDFDGSNFASGVYFYRIEAGTFTDVKRFMLIK
ncbi:MAG: T9SS type A sorting domain-containing protein, partial [Ignavibacteria bacterium]|nr:T9SS type A sorting domain-containing protein [Ignavibacteria bacterium]